MYFQFAKRTMMGMTHMMSDGEPSQPVEVQLPGWFWGFCAICLIAFLPGSIYISYTLSTLFPTLAMIEDPEPPAYEPLATNADGPETPRAENDDAPSAPSVPITSSLHQMNRLLRSIGGFRSHFRGIWCAFFTFVAASTLQGVFESFIPGRLLSSIIAPLPAILLTLPLSTAWTHIAMSQPKAVPWYKRLPNMQKTFSALWRPACIVWAAFAVVTGVSRGMHILLGLNSPFDSENPQAGVQVLWKSAVIGVVALVLSLGLVVPAHVLFTRIQASLLPLEDEPILAFDRSFGGNVEPQLINGKGYASLADAWKTFSKASWWRLVKLYAKVIGISILYWAIIGATFIPVLFVALNKAKRSDGSTPQ